MNEWKFTIQLVDGDDSGLYKVFKKLKEWSESETKENELSDNKKTS